MKNKNKILAKINCKKLKIQNQSKIKMEIKSKHVKYLIQITKLFRILKIKVKLKSLRLQQNQNRNLKKLKLFMRQLENQLEIAFHFKVLINKIKDKKQK